MHPAPLSIYAEVNAAPALKSRLGSFLNVPAESLCLGHGAEDLILKLLQWKREGSSKLFLASFSWGEYRRLGEGLGFQVEELGESPHFCEAPPSLATEIGVISEQLRDRVLADPQLSAVVLLATTNNPTGSSLDISAAEALVREFAGTQTHFIFDAVYEQLPSEWFHRFANTPNVNVLGSFSKYFGMPGLRLGFCCGSVPPAFHLSLGHASWQLRTAQAALQNCEHYATARQHMIRFAALLHAEQGSWPHVVVHPTQAPFVLAHVRRSLSREPSQNSQRDFESIHWEGLLHRCEAASGVWPKVFEHQSHLWLRFGLGPEKICRGVLQFLRSLDEEIQLALEK